MQATQLSIDGVFLTPQAGGSLEATDPATEIAFARIAAGTAPDADAAVRAARRAFDQWPWPHLPAADRAAALRRIAEGITPRLAEISAVETRDNGKPPPEPEWDIGDAAIVFTCYADLAESHEAEGAQSADLADDAFSGTISTELLGVVGSITQWNFPLLIGVWKVEPALAAGCMIALKPSEFCSASCAILAEIKAGKATKARLVTGGGRPAGMDTGYPGAPTIFADVPTDATIRREEIFGPVVCINPFDTEEEALVLANDSPHVLAGAVMSDDLERCERVASKLRADIIWINCSQPTFRQVPWGGYKTSGIGREPGTAGLMGFREIKQIARNDRTRNCGWYLET